MEPLWQKFGSINFWISEDSFKKGKAKKNKNLFGRPFIYFDDAILTAMIIRFVYHLPLRAMEGFLRSLFALLHVPVLSFSYTQVCRREKKLLLPAKLKSRKITDIVFQRFRTESKNSLCF